MLLSDAIIAFGRDRQARGISPGTRRNEANILTLFLAEIGNVQTKRLRPQHVDAFWVNRTAAWAPGTINRARTSLNTFFKWCQARGYVSRSMDLLEGSKALRVPPRNRVVIPQDQFSTLLEEASSPRLRVAYAFGLYLFTRISETQGLRWQDINMQAGTVEVFRKKTLTLDTLPICTELAHEIRLWRLDYATVMGEQPQPGWFIIPGRQPLRGSATPGQKGFTPGRGGGGQLLPAKESDLSKIVKNGLREAGYYQQMEGGHTLRRSGAIALYNQLSSVGHDRAIRVCQAMLGHSSIRTTEIYLRLDLDRKVRNDLLAGHYMFPEATEATVVVMDALSKG